MSNQDDEIGSDGELQRVSVEDLSKPTEAALVERHGLVPIVGEMGHSSDGEILRPIAAVSEAESMGMPLTAPQRTAIELLTSGQTLVASATAAGVSRMTLYRWLKGDAAFIAAYNAWQQDVLDTARGRVLALSELAVTTMAKAMQRGDGKIAFKVLKEIGALDRPVIGSTDLKEVHRVQSLKLKKAEAKLRKAEGKADGDTWA